MKKISFLALLLAPFALLLAQAQGPSFTGEWRPVVGKGAEYKFEAKGKAPMVMSMAVVGKEGSSYWLENVNHMEGQTVISKMLMGPNGATRMIMKNGNHPAMEMPVGQHNGQSAEQKGDLTNRGKLIGREKVTVPAGTFLCEHYQIKEEGETSDVWVSAQVAPYGIVKMVSSDTTMTLMKNLSGVKTQITETPMKISVPGFGM